MKVKRRSRLERTAFHEAGHAVTSYLMHRGNRKVTIVPDEKSGTLGHHLCASLGKKFDPDLNTDARTRNRVEADVMVSLAGTIAESLCQGKNPRALGGSGDDMRHAANMVSYLVGDGEELNAYLNWLFVRTRNLLRMSANWAAVEELGARLIEKRTLGGREAREIIRGAIQQFYNQTVPPIAITVEEVRPEVPARG